MGRVKSVADSEPSGNTPSKAEQVSGTLIILFLTHVCMPEAAPNSGTEHDGSVSYQDLPVYHPHQAAG